MTRSPCGDPSNQHSTAWTPLPFSFSFLLFLRFLFASPFCRSPCSPSPSLFLFRSFCRFPFVSCIAFFTFIFASLRSLVADSVISSRRYTPPALLASLKYAYSPCVDVDLFLFFFSSFPFSISIWTSFVFHPVFFLWVLCCLLGFGFCCDSFSI